MQLWFSHLLTKVHNNKNYVVFTWMGVPLRGSNFHVWLTASCAAAAGAARPVETDAAAGGVGALGSGGWGTKGAACVVAGGGGVLVVVIVVVGIGGCGTKGAGWVIVDDGGADVAVDVCTCACTAGKSIANRPCELDVTIAPAQVSPQYILNLKREWKNEKR